MCSTPDNCFFIILTYFSWREEDDIFWMLGSHTLMLTILWQIATGGQHWPPGPYASFPLKGEAEVTVPFFREKRRILWYPKGCPPQDGFTKGNPSSRYSKNLTSETIYPCGKGEIFIFTLVPTTFQISFMVSFRALTEPHCRITEEKKLYTLGWYRVRPGV